MLLLRLHLPCQWRPRSVNFVAVRTEEFQSKLLTGRIMDVQL